MGRSTGLIASNEIYVHAVFVEAALVSVKHLLGTAGMNARKATKPNCRPIRINLMY
jgi:hypothetical protein